MEGETTNELYRECLRNHAASLGSYATDGCGEFTRDDTSPNGSLQCAACGCHRNFHRKVTYTPTTNTTTRGLSYSRSGHDQEMMEFSDGGRQQLNTVVESPDGADRNAYYSTSGKKRFRTKFTPDQKEKMLAFAEKLGWKLLRKDMEDEIERFCRGIGVSRQVFKVWMHNHKNSSSSSSASTGNASSLTQ